MHAAIRKYFLSPTTKESDMLRIADDVLDEVRALAFRTYRYGLGPVGMKVYLEEDTVQTKKWKLACGRSGCAGTTFKYPGDSLVSEKSTNPLESYAPWKTFHNNFLRSIPRNSTYDEQSVHLVLQLWSSWPATSTAAVSTAQRFLSPCQKAGPTFEVKKQGAFCSNVNLT